MDGRLPGIDQAGTHNRGKDEETRSTCTLGVKNSLTKMVVTWSIVVEKASKNPAL